MKNASLAKSWRTSEIQQLATFKYAEKWAHTTDDHVRDFVPISIIRYLLQDIDPVVKIDTRYRCDVSQRRIDIS